MIFYLIPNYPIKHEFYYNKHFVRFLISNMKYPRQLSSILKILAVFIVFRFFHKIDNAIIIKLNERILEAN